MAYNYEFKYPRKKLHEIVSRYLAQMNTMGRAPNCGVFFSRRTFVGPAVKGWLIRHPDDDGSVGRYVLLEDGDVWLDDQRLHDVEVPGGGWLNAPSDDLAVLLAQSLKSARTGGDGLLASGDLAACQVVVEDRRSAMASFMGREKRLH